MKLLKQNVTKKNKIQIGSWVIPAAIWWLVVIGLVGAVLYPVGCLLVHSFKVDDGYGISNYLAIFQDDSIQKSMLNTLKVVSSTTIFSTIIGVFLAWVVVRTDIPGKKLWEYLLMIPYYIPPFIGAIAWTLLLSPIGYFNKALMSIFSLETAPINVYSIGGIVFVLTMYRYAISFLIVLPAMKRISNTLEEAARMSGASIKRTMVDVVLPMLMPSIMGGLLLTFMFVLADFGVAAVLGIPQNIRLMTTQIYWMISHASGNSMNIASAYSVFLSIFGIIGLVCYNKILGKEKYVAITGKSAAAEIIRLKKWKWVLLPILVIFFALTTLSPVIATFITSITKTYGLEITWSNLTFDNFVTLFSIKNVLRAIKNSLFLSFGSAVIIMAVTLVIGYMSVRKNMRGVKCVGMMQALVTLPYALPGTMIAFAMILAFSQELPIINVKLYNTIWIMLIAYVVRYMNLGFNNISGAISQIDKSLEEAARMSGATILKAVCDITIPILKSSLITSVFLVVAPTISEITLSSLLWSINNETIGTIVYAAQEEGRILRVASMAILLTVFAVLLNTFIQWLSKKKVQVNPDMRFVGRLKKKVYHLYTGMADAVPFKTRRKKWQV